MKNSSAIGALVMIGLAVAIGVFALQSDDGAVDADLVEPAPTARRASFQQDLSPQERKKKANMEEAKRYLKRVKEEGVNVSGDLWRIKDDDGTPLYVVGHLIEGYDAFGEPKYLLHKIKREAGVPRMDKLKVDVSKLPEAQRPKIAKKKVQLDFIEKTDSGKGRMGNKKGLGDADGSGGGESGGGGGDASGGSGTGMQGAPGGGN